MIERDRFLVTHGFSEGTVSSLIVINDLTAFSHLQQWQIANGFMHRDRS